MEVVNELKELNLDENEIKVFLACLKLGTTKVNDISREAELIRTTTYGVLKSLKEKGFISTIIKDNITHFQAIEPKLLVDLLEEKKERIASVIPKLEGIANIASPFPKVDFFEGENGIKTIFSDLLKYKNQEVKHIGVVSPWMERARMFTIIYYRKKKNVSSFK